MNLYSGTPAIRSVPLQPSTPPPPPACPGTYQEAGSFDRQDYLLDPGLVAALDTHMAMHYVPGLRLENQRGLLIVGEPGDGKSTTIKVHASRRGIDVLQMPAADLCGATEGLAVQRLNEACAYMHAKSAEAGRHMLFQLDDLDASIVDERKDQERTINSSLLIGKLQSLLESPDACRDAMGIPIAFVFTANTVANFRAPLLRDGRCQVFRYRPTWQWKADAQIHHLRPSTDRDRKRLRCLVYKYRIRPMAWFTALAADLKRAAIASAVAEHGLADHDAIVRAADQARLDVRALFRLAKARHKATPITTEEVRS